MKLYSFTKNGGSEYVLPTYRDKWVDKLPFNPLLIDIPGAIGRYNPNKYNVIGRSKTCQIKFSIYAATPTQLDDLIDAAVDAFSTNGIVKAVRSDGVYLQQEFTVSAVQKDWSRAKFNICDITVDGELAPNWLSSTLYTASINMATGGTLNVTSKYDVLQSLTLTVLNSSGVSKSNFNIKNTTSGSDISVLLLNSGDTINIDVGANYVWYTSNVYKPNERKSIAINAATQIELFKLVNGVNTITVTPNFAGTITFNWRNVWL